MTFSNDGPIEEDALPRKGSQDSAGESPVDWELASSLTGGDLDLLSELVDLFPTESAKHLAVIRSAIDACDPEVLTRGAHSLKSTASFFGARDLVTCARHVEELGRTSEIDEARTFVPRLQSETARLNAALARERIPN